VNVVLDTTLLLVLVDPNVPVPKDFNDKPILHARERLNLLIAELQKTHRKILIPTPALAELVWLAEKAGPQYVTLFNKYGGVFQVVDFDQRAAIELAMMTAIAKKAGSTRAGSAESMAKIKFDRQIVATAKVNKAVSIYTCDSGLKKFAENHGLDAVHLRDMPLPPQDIQSSLPLENGDEANP
jgi:predicted nucleic acid-binding protein